ncbi:proteinase R [Sodiomyces alkalinus F11]|uniref:Proteinase R n=1 Tax=Sodiomyces alkalinus (strain CBS 110278 / VKM F-3762 / F11) TaxID=1314773 RepID=A0A3N2Q6J5_SODAK|nr:proteinase R [Sodiomyces alkalinus F11]ROT42394.1 proteinase R [Sodiomyces alkalinus F11]
MAGEIITGEWIVTLKPYANEALEDEHISYINDRNNDPGTHFHCRVRDRFCLPELRGYTAKFDDETKAELEDRAEVATIEPVQIYRHCATVQSGAPWGLARISTRTRLPATGPYDYRYDATGEGSVAYVIDTGINDAHVEFEGRATKGAKFVSLGPAGDEDVNGHGTHVAGTIAGKTYGVAKKAEVVGVKVFNDFPRPGATNGDIIRALQWAVDEAKKHGKPSVVNMSLGGGASDALDRAVASTVRSGVVVCVAAGNDGQPSHLGSPAREPLAITVGATTIEDAVPPFSSWGKIIDIFAPGVAIQSSWIGSLTASATISGTSMASPHVAGAVCCLLGQEKLEPLLVMPQLLIWADKNKLSGLRDRSINALLQVSDAST